MKIRFDCPSCGATGSADESKAGRSARCPRCGHQFIVPVLSEPEADGYGIEPSALVRPTSTPRSAVFIPSRGDEPVAAPSPRKTRSSPAKRRRPIDDQPEFAWGTWSIRLGVAALLILVGIAVFAPRGLVIAGSTLVAVGVLMILVGYGAGAYGAFSEDFLYGVLYLVLPLYNAYYLVTRWDDLWKWFLCSTVGVGFVAVGTRLLEWGGVVG